MNVLITGGGSILGQPLAIRMARLGHKVTVVYRSFNEWVSGLQGQADITLVQKDIAEQEAIESLLTGTESIIFHLAATSPRPGIGPIHFIRDNIHVTQKLSAVAAIRGVRKFVFLSSMSVYGDVSAPFVSERTPIVNPGIYGISKRLCEQCLEMLPMQSVSIRLPALIGRGAHRHWLARLVEKAKANEEIVIFNPDAPFNNAVHVSDMVKFLVRLSESDWRQSVPFPIGAHGIMPIRFVVEAIKRGLNSSSPVTIEPSASQSFIIDSTYAIEHFSYKPSPIEEIIDHFASESRP